MKRRSGVCVAVAGFGFLLGGCAQAPCPIIPAQLELAEARAARARQELQTRSEDIASLQRNVARLEEQTVSLEEEKAVLLELIGEAKEAEE